ncbi:MAG: YciI family protein [Gammaproteobacteria bacterium]
MTTEPIDLSPPGDLEDRVVARLYQARLIQPFAKEKDMTSIHLRWGLAATVLLAAGIWAGTLVPKAAEPAAAPEAPVPAAADTRPAFALMLYEDANYQAPASGEEHAARVAEYSAWARKLAATGNLVDGAELLARGVLLRRDAPRAEGIPVAAEGMLAGYFVIRAASFEEAEKIAADCPHLVYGGTVSLRPTGA